MPTPRAAWSLLGTLEGLADRLRAAADALGGPDDVEAAWLRGAAELVDRGEPERRAARMESVWLEELAPEARARKVSLLAAWVNSAEALRSAVRAHESERGPLVEALFPLWRGASLRRHADQALAAQVELQRRLGSAYVVRRLAELATQSAVGPALEALAAAGTVWAAERERPALSGAKADEVRTSLLALAQESALLLERVRWVVRAALVRRPDLLETVFPKRTRPAGPDTAPSDRGGGGAEESATPAEGAPGELPSDLGREPSAAEDRVAAPPEGAASRPVGRRAAAADTASIAASDGGDTGVSRRRRPGARRKDQPPATQDAPRASRPRRPPAKTAPPDSSGPETRPAAASRRRKTATTPSAPVAEPAPGTRAPPTSEPRPRPPGGARGRARPKRRS